MTKSSDDAWKKSVDDRWAAKGFNDYITLVKFFEQAKAVAKDGNTLAQLVVGNMYSQGQGVIQNYAEAVR